MQLSLDFPAWVTLASTVAAYTIGLPNVATVDDTTLTDFDPFSCTRTSTPVDEASNDWQNLQFSTDTLPSPAAYASFVDANFTYGIVSRSDGGNESLAVSQSLCIQHRHFQFTHENGWIRTRPYMIRDANSDYYIVWNTNFPARIRVWQDQGQGTGRWKLMDETQVSSMRGQWHLKGFEWLGKELMVDLSVGLGLGAGTTGEIALFSTSTYPKAVQEG